MFYVFNDTDVCFPPSIRKHLSKDVQRNTCIFKSQCTEWIQTEQRNGAGYLLPRVQTNTGDHTSFYPVHRTDFLAEVNVIENSVLTRNDVARFPSVRGKKLQWLPLKEIMNFKKNHSYFLNFLLFCSII